MFIERLCKKHRALLYFGGNLRAKSTRIFGLEKTRAVETCPQRTVFSVNWLVIWFKSAFEYKTNSEQNQAK